MTNDQGADPAPRARRNRRARGLYPKGDGAGRSSGANRPLPEYLEQVEIEALLQAAIHERARLLMLLQWRAGLRISEALDLERADVMINLWRSGVDVAAAENAAKSGVKPSEQPTLRIRMGKGRRTRVVPVHPELEKALAMALAYGKMSGPIIGVRRSQGSEWIKRSVAAAVDAGLLEPGKRISSHTLRHSYARHLLANGIPINVVSRWLGHRSLTITMIYLELLPDPSGSLSRVP